MYRKFDVNINVGAPSREHSGKTKANFSEQWTLIYIEIFTIEPIWNACVALWYYDVHCISALSLKKKNP